MNTSWGLCALKCEGDIRDAITNAAAEKSLPDQIIDVMMGPADGQCGSAAGFSIGTIPVSGKNIGATGEENSRLRS